MRLRPPATLRPARTRAPVLATDLARRSQRAIAAIELHCSGDLPLDLVDFGCADGAMLFTLARRLGRRFGSGVGFDVFRGGMPSVPEGLRVRFVLADLFRDYPFVLPDRSRDVAVVSAFLKYHPSPVRFLGEVARILRPGGIAVVLDPRPLVVHLGSLVGRFNKGYIPALWGRDRLRAFVSGPAAQEAARLEMVEFERYWVAPTARLYRTGVEAWLSRQIVQLVGLHQCAVLRRVDHYEKQQ